MPKLVLLDGHALAYRAFFALPAEMATKTGELTNATFGFTTMLLDVLERERPEYIAVAFDVGRTWRHTEYSEYKGHRVKAPSELHPQVDRIKEVVRAFNIPIFTALGWEGDDVIGTLARQAAEQGVDVLIVTADSDAHQLVTDKITVQTTGRFFKDTKLYNPVAIEERYGLKPSQLIDYKALLGDKSDNIPGVAGIGEKTATSLLQQYGTLEGVYEHLPELKGGVQKKLEAGQRDAFMSKRLGAIDRNVPGVKLDLDACRTRDFDHNAVFELFRALQFTSLIDRIPQPDGAAQRVVEALPEVETSYALVTSEQELEALAREINEAKAVTLDVETDGLDSVTANLVGLAVGLGQGRAYYIPVGHVAALPEGQLSLGAELPPAPQNLPLERVTALLNPSICRPGLNIFAHNSKFDIEVMLQHGFQVPAVEHDTMIGAWLLNPGSRAVGLKALALSELGQPMTEITDLIGKGRSQITMAQVAVEAVTPYACADVDMTARLVPLQVQQLQDRSLFDLFHDIEMPLVRVLVDMELRGVAFDPEALTQVRETLNRRLGELEKGIYEHAGYEFNINSPQQLSEVLFDKLELDRRKSTRTAQGAYSTAVNVLEALQGSHPIIELILEQRSLQKLLSTYVDQLITMVNPQTRRIHTTFSQTTAETGRLSSSNPNLQNIPVRSEMGREIRRAFVAPDGHFLLACDYSQVELRVLAHLSEDPVMIEAFRQGEDIHAATANRLFNVPINEVSRDQRRIAKIINFGLLFGMSAFRLAREASIPYAEAEEALHIYFRTFPNIEAYLEGIVEQAQKVGYAETIAGRRRYFPELQQNRYSNQGRAAERAAKNHPIQGSAAEIIKVAMINIHETLQASNLKTAMVLQVHDELLFEVPESELSDVAPLVMDIMSNAMDLKVPLGVDAKVGHNWDEMVPLQDFLE
jgi:DNA polymerase-1